MLTHCPPAQGDDKSPGHPERGLCGRKSICDCYCNLRPGRLIVVLNLSLNGVCVYCVWSWFSAVEEVRMAPCFTEL
ncbi:hypothetical protein P691DRAFT_467140 [Macrolepiota fuliginosa MF-IS2]|uniref:Uncharacterized protein n=1 Tax=Macrolepiota fuliginosa MF-IS2 TaxID=1400762 RepID=A0A9P6BW88_9AGAR|nr:hypothetical protein P691DRAFT_467140 [Macrolepiota fuliginosa MF-IS2]